MTITPITTNKNGEVGLCEGKIPAREYIGKFDPKFLKEWVDMILLNLGNRQLYLYSHASENPATTAKCLVAMAEPDDEIFVCCVGCEEDKVTRK